MRGKQVRGVLCIVGGSSSNCNVIMNCSSSHDGLFQHRYYRLSKILMLLSGQWPYQSNGTRRGILAIFIFFIAYQVVAQILAIVKYRDDWNILLECLVPNVFDAVCATKYLGFVYSSRNISKLLDRIRVDWQVWARHEEVKILHEYAERGGNIVIVYTAMLYFGVFVFMIQPMIRKLIDVSLKNGTEPGRFLFPVVYYHVDMQKYYVYLIMYSTICSLIILSTGICSEVMLILSVQHACSIFAAVGHKIERIGSNGTSAKKGESPYALVKSDKEYLASCIDRHNDAIEYSNLINASYAWNIFFTVVFGMILLNASGLQMLLRTSDLMAISTFAILTLGVIICFYLECSISQILINHSISIRLYINNCQWYRLPLKTQKILQLMTMRCNVPCHLTAGNMLIMSVHTFGLTMQTALSYFAFIRSMQGL